MKCTCHKEIEEHPCPYMQKMFGDDAVCRCCPGCEKDCSEDVEKLKNIIEDESKN